MKRLLIKLGVRIGDPFDWEPTPWTRLRLWAKRHLTRKANATCAACGYRGIRTRRHRWCPACHEDLGGELIRDRSSADQVRCPKCGGPHPFHDPACVVHPDLTQDHNEQEQR